MAACGSLRHLFERPLPENPTLMESLSWSQLKAVKPDDGAFTEIFGELHFEERRPTDCTMQTAQAPSPASDKPFPSAGTVQKGRYRQHEDPSAGSNPMSGEHRRHSSLDALLGVPSHQCGGSLTLDAIVSPKGRSESLQLCTEGLGFESSDDVEISRTGAGWDWSARGREMAAASTTGGVKRQYRRSRSDVRVRTRGDFPPPISCIGSSGKPWVSFRSYREDGRFVLREVKIPCQELLRASREGGRLKLHFAQPDEEVVEEGQEPESAGGAEEVKDEGEETKGPQEGQEGEREEAREEIGVD